MRLGYGAASRFDSHFSGCGCTDTCELDRFGQRTGIDNLHHFGQLTDQASLLECQHVNFSRAQNFQVGQSDFSIELQQMRLETALRQTALQRHLTAFKTDLVIAARTGLLTLVTTASGFTQARANATTYAATGFFGAVSRRNSIEFHYSTFTR